MSDTESPEAKRASPDELPSPSESPQPKEDAVVDKADESEPRPPEPSAQTAFTNPIVALRPSRPPPRRSKRLPAYTFFTISILYIVLLIASLAADVGAVLTYYFKYDSLTWTVVCGGGIFLSFLAHGVLGWRTPGVLHIYHRVLNKLSMCTLGLFGLGRVVLQCDRCCRGRRAVANAGSSALTSVRMHDHNRVYVITDGILRSLPVLMFQFYVIATTQLASAYRDSRPSGLRMLVIVVSGGLSLLNASQAVFHLSSDAMVGRWYWRVFILVDVFVHAARAAIFAIAYHIWVFAACGVAALGCCVILSVGLGREPRTLRSFTTLALLFLISPMSTTLLFHFDDNVRLPVYAMLWIWDHLLASGVMLTFPIIQPPIAIFSEGLSVHGICKNFAAVNRNGDCFPFEMVYGIVMMAVIHQVTC